MYYIKTVVVLANIEFRREPSPFIWVELPVVDEVRTCLMTNLDYFRITKLMLIKYSY